MFTTHSDMNARTVALLLIGLLPLAGFARIQLPGFFSDGMVLQQGMDVPVWGQATYANAFPKGSFNLRGSMPFFPMVTPYAEATFTTYKKLAGGSTPPDTKAVTLGAAVGLDLLAVEAMYQVLKTNGAASRSFYGIGAQLRL